MPITRTILKKVQQQAVVKFVGDGQANIDLAELKTNDETFQGYANANVNINSVIWSIPDGTNTLIKRDGSNVLVLYGNDNWTFTQAYGFADTSNNTANINITLPTGGGTLILGVTKTAGYVPTTPKQTLESWQKNP